LATVVALFAHINLTHAAAITWDGGGSDGTCGGNAGDGNKWSCALNWSGDTLPTSADAVTFNGTSTKDATVDASFTGVITSLNIASGYTGTITMARSLQISANYTQATGTFTAANQTLDIDGSITLSAGTFTASSGNTTLAGALTISGSPTFNANSGTITFDGNSATLACNNVTFNLVVFNSASQSKTVNADCTMPLGNNPTISLMGLKGTLTGTGALTQSSSSTMSIQSATAAITGFSSFSVPSFSVNSGASINLSALTSYSGANLTVAGGLVSPPSMTLTNGTFTLSTGTGSSFTAPSGTLTLAGTTLTFTGGSFVHNSGTVALTGGSASFACNNVAFNLVTFNNSGAKTIGSDCSFPLGANPTLSGTSTVTVNGTLSGTGTLTKSTSTLTMNTGSSLSGFTGLVVPSLTVAGATLNLSSYSPVTISSVFTESSGSFTAPSGTMSVSSNFTVSNGSFDANNGTLLLDGSSAAVSCNNISLSRVAIVLTNTGGTKTVSSNCSLPLGPNPTITGRVDLSGILSGTGTINADLVTFRAGSALSGFTGYINYSNGITIAGATLDMSNYSPVTFLGGMTMSSGSFTAPGTVMTTTNINITGGTFNHNNGLVIINGAGTTSCVNTTFNRVALSPGNNGSTIIVGPTCTFPLGNNPTIGGLSGRVSVAGTLTGSGTLTSDSKISGTLTLTGNGRLTGFSGLILHGDLTLQSGVILDLSEYSPVIIYADISNNALTLAAGSSLIAPRGTMTLYDTINNTGGNFVHNNGTVEFVISDLDTINVIQGASHTFYNLTATALSSNSNILFLQAGKTQTILGTLTLQGVDSTKPLNIQSNISGSTASIDPRGPRIIHNATVKDIANVNAIPINAGDGTVADWGNNSGFDFGSPYIVNVRPTNLVDGSTTYDTQPGFSFTLGKTPSTAKVSYRVELDDTADFSSPVVDYSFGLTTQGTHSFKVGQAANGGTYAAGSEGQSLTPGSYYLRIVSHDEAGNTSSWYTANSGKAAFVLGLHSDAFSIVSPKNKQTLTYTRPYIRFHTATGSNFPISSYRIVLNKVNALWGNPEEDTVWFDSIEPTKPDKGTSRTKESAYISYDGDIISLYGRGTTQELTNGNYRLRVVAVDTYGTTAETTPTEFRIHLSSLNTEITEQTSGTESVVADTPTDESTSTSNPSPDSSVAATTKRYLVKIKVVNTDKVPVSGATVVLHSTPRTGKTDKDGAVSFKDVEPGQHTVKVTYAGQSGEQPLTVASDTRTDTDINVTIKIEATNPFSSSSVITIVILLVLITLGAIMYALYTIKKHPSRQ
jgi:hypothetical protein